MLPTTTKEPVSSHMSDASGKSLPFDDALMSEIRARFVHVDSEPGLGQRIFFENGGGSLTLGSVIEVQKVAASLPANAGRANAGSHAVEQYIAEGVRALEDFMHVDRGVVISCESTTSHAFRMMEAAARQAKPGANIVCSDLDHACFHDAAAYYAKLFGLTRRVVSMDVDTGTLTPESVAEQVDEDTAIVSIIHASNITGGKNDLRAIAEAVRSKNPDAYILADGAQHVQHATADVSELGVDSYVFSAYKVFSCPGYAFAYLSERAAKLPHARLAGKRPDEWNLGTRDQAAYACFTQVVEYLCWLGERVSGSQPGAATRRELIKYAFDAIERHEIALGKNLLQGRGGTPGLLQHSRIQLYGNKNSSREREAVYAFCVDGISAKDVVRYFVDRGIIIHDRANDVYSGHTMNRLGVDAIVRVSLAHYNTSEEVERFLAVLNELASQLTD